MNAMKEEFKYFELAGATVKKITAAPEFDKTDKSKFAITGDTGYEGWLKWIQDHHNSPYKSPPEITNSQLRIPQLRSASTTYTGAGAMSDNSIQEFVNYRQAYQARLAKWMEDEGVDAVVFAGEPSTIHLNDGNENSFARETSTGLRLDPQASNAGVPTAIFPAGTNPVGSPDNLQLEGPAYSDPELLGMAYAFELYANGHRETKYAPALSYVPDSVTPPQVVVAPAPPTTTEAPKPTEPTEHRKGRAGGAPGRWAEVPQGQARGDDRLHRDHGQLPRDPAAGRDGEEARDADRGHRGRGQAGDGDGEADQGAAQADRQRQGRHPGAAGQPRRRRQEGEGRHQVVAAAR